MKTEFPVITITREDLEWKGFKAADLNDDTMEVIASKMADILLDGDYWDALVASAEWHGIPRKRGTIKEHLNDFLVDDETPEGGTQFAGETLFDFLSSLCDGDLEGISDNDDVPVLDDYLKQCGIKPIGLED